MLNITIDIEGFDKIKKMVEQAPEKTVREVNRAIEKSILETHSAILREAPVNKRHGGGNLRQNIKHKMINKLHGEVVSNAKYSVYVHEGTRPHQIRAVRKRVLADKRTGQMFGKVVNHPGTIANKYMERGIKATENKINRNFKTAMENILKI